ncbi:ladinin-1-like isoform X1 [Brachionichthys hirsutus]|uniref:ladinin-1-like isoform X1 n=1 Tax=Brachionichthys hirsutus TaxID=412623 RepID=UPI0036053723
MSISRRNWSALSSLASQWSREDEEEVEREKRRRIRGSSSTADLDPDVDLPRDASTSPGTFETDSMSEMSQELTSVGQIQVDFVEMLRVRDEKRRMRHVEALRRQKNLEEEEEAEFCRGDGGEARVEILNKDQGLLLPPAKATSKPQPPQRTAPLSPNSNSSICNTSTDITGSQIGNGESPGGNPEPTAASNRTRKFVSSLSISLDQSPSAGGCRSPPSSCSPTDSVSPREHRTTPCQNPPEGAQGTVRTGALHVSNVSSNGSFEPTAKPAFVRHSSRTISFRMMRKKEEEIAPLQRSASVRMTSKKFESAGQHEEEDKTSSFQRNSRQRISSRSIQEKMERLAQAAQKSSETTRSPDVAQRTLLLMDEVSRKRGLFEKEQRAVCPTSPGVSRQEFKRFTSGMSDRINRWLNKTNQAGSSECPDDLKHADMTKKKSVFERSGTDAVPKRSSEENP